MRQSPPPGPEGSDDRTDGDLAGSIGSQASPIPDRSGVLPAVVVDQRIGSVIVDEGQHAVLCFSPDGRLLSRFGADGGLWLLDTRYTASLRRCEVVWR